MLLLPNEEILTSSNQNKITLSNLRIYMSDSIWGNSHKIGIFLEDVSSVESKYTSKVLFIALSVISALVGFIGTSHYEMSIVLGLIGAAVFLILWYASRTHIISIASNGGSAINFIVTDMSSESIENFIYNVSFAKQKRINTLYKI